MSTRFVRLPRKKRRTTEGGLFPTYDFFITTGNPSYRKLYKLDVYNYFMEQIRTRVKKWGNSFGIVLPKHFVDERKIKEGSEIEITVNLSNTTKVRDIFGILKELKGDTKKILEETDEEFEPE